MEKNRLSDKLVRDIADLYKQIANLNGAVVVHKPYMDAICALLNKQQSYVDGQKDELNYMRDVINQQEATIAAYRSTIDKQEAELDKHKKHLNRNIVVAGSRGCGKSLYQMNQIELRIDKIKAEAIKEFAERLKEVHYMQKGEVVGRFIYTDEIDNLVKELVGEE